MSRIQVLSNRQRTLGTIAGTLVLVLALGCTSYTEPVWTSVAKVEGTSYVTDGTLAIDMRLVEASPPTSMSASKWFMESLFQNLKAETPEQFSIDEIRASTDGNQAIVLGPGDQQLEEKYVTYLSGKLGSDHRIAFWQLSEMEPMIIVVDGKPVGALKALN